MSQPYIRNVTYFGENPSIEARKSSFRSPNDIPYLLVAAVCSFAWLPSHIVALSLREVSYPALFSYQAIRYSCRCFSWNGRSSLRSQGVPSLHIPACVSYRFVSFFPV
ncbi:hypothetical protein K491DRAFT_171640 [Lophiostoma macrostomum CBS 122681]|uniref:Uncharacterized protein n=1 Tax=Lophiostoma macrostomum CBS 122681 TaxID=1314788 RepID=A0A6A6SQ16_9PLEO|nr:hypothetical protein K491DRAFT_171640 [Lophiostoma macrostomum CBS 122681]